MHISSSYSGRCFKTARQAQSFMDAFGLTLLHYYSDSYAEIYVVEDANHNRTDLAVPYADRTMADCYLRINVDDMDEAVKDLTAHGFALLKEPEETDARITALMRDSIGTDIIIYQHIKD